MNIHKIRSFYIRSILGRSGILIRVVIFVAIWLVLPLHASVYPVGIEDELELTIDGVGRVTDLTIGPQNILFCDNTPTGGFYIRENSIPFGSQIPEGCTNLVTNSTLGSDTIFDPPIPPIVPENDKWYKFTDIVVCNKTLSQRPH